MKDKFEYYQLSLKVERVNHDGSRIIEGSKTPHDIAMELKGYEQVICIFDIKEGDNGFERLGQIIKVLAATGEALGDGEL
jgi:hypothetical protein